MELHNTDNIEILQKMEDNSIHAVVTDPPYALNSKIKVDKALKSWLEGEDYFPGGKGFMNQTWDSFLPQPSFWKEVLRVLKPGGHLLCFSAVRNAHLMTLSIQLAGFEIRDALQWIYANAMPKHLKSQLKPAHEPIILARKPFKGGLENVFQANGTGYMNISECKIEFRDPMDIARYDYNRRGGVERSNVEEGKHMDKRKNWGFRKQTELGEMPEGRFPTNVLLDPASAELMESQKESTSFYFKVFEEGEYDVFRYVAKAKKDERNRGLGKGKENNHLTVKPISLLQYLCRLVTFENGLILDPFMGSGTTGIACALEGRRFIGVEIEKEYFDVAKERIETIQNEILK